MAPKLPRPQRESPPEPSVGEAIAMVVNRIDWNIAELRRMQQRLYELETRMETRWMHERFVRECWNRAWIMRIRTCMSDEERYSLAVSSYWSHYWKWVEHCRHHVWKGVCLGDRVLIPWFSRTGQIETRALTDARVILQPSFH